MTWKNINYSSADLMSMQQDALRRVRQMQQLANSKITPSPRFDQPPPPAAPRRQIPSLPPTPPSSAAAKNEASATAASSLVGNPLGDLFAAFGGDSDRLMILVLLIVLLGEGADQKLLLALCYLLL